MASATKSKNPWPKFETITKDGRRQRSDRSRRRIIEAMFDLIREGNMSPSATRVAARANVGLRTVFRHFEDIDSIYDEMTEELTTAVMPKILAPYESTDWRERLMECVEKRADLYETVFPMKVCMSLRRFQSAFLQKQYEQDIMHLRQALKAILPKEVTSNKALFSALEVTLAFTTWRRLRQDQNLSVENAKASLRLILNGLVAEIHAD